MLMTDLVSVQPLSAPSMNLVYVDFVYIEEAQKHINNIFDMLTKTIFTEEDKSQYIHHTNKFFPLFKNNSNSIIHHTKKRSNGDYWTTIKITLNKNNKDNKNNYYRNILCDILKDKNIKIEFGTSTKFNIKTRSLLNSYTYYLKGLKIVNKFKL